MTRHIQGGFSAVELLITLFIGVAFIATGYQLFSIITKNGGEVRARAVASNIAYQNLQRYASLTTNPCVATNTPSPTPTIPAGTLANSSITVSISCPYGAISISKVSVSVFYGNPQQEVIHATYVTN